MPLLALLIFCRISLYPCGNFKWK